MSAASLSLILFGAPTLGSGHTRALEFERRTQLLVYLALRREWVPRAEVAALLWPEQETKLAYTNLRKALHRLQAMPGGSAVDGQGTSLRCQTETDVNAFETALREQRIDDALQLYRGELLHGFDDDDNPAWSGWLRFERERLRSAWRSAAQAQLTAGALKGGAAIDLSARLLDSDPLDEAALGLYLEELARAGQGARARQTYSEFEARLREELGIEPSAELRRWKDRLGSVASSASPVRAPAPVVVDESFIGRAVELRRIVALLGQAECRLLCVTGQGGVGKTRLARRALRELAAGFADGAAFVALEELTAANDIAGRIALELEIPLKGGELTAQLIRALRERQVLLVLDNFEHLTDGAPLVQRLLDACPRLKLLVTSRVRLALASEWLLPLDGLPCPEDDDLDRVEAFDAARLFVAAAQRVQPDFVPATEAAPIAAICRQVGGLPLALELAAAWTRVLSCSAIAEELRQGGELLHASDAAQPARHASMQVVFDQSWRLLSEVERKVLARLAVFAGGFSAEAARAVTGARLPVLAALTDKSLLRREGERVHLHPLVQQLALERLDAATAAIAHTAHADYFLRLLAQLRNAAGAGDRVALDRVEIDYDNCRRALLWTAEHGPADAVVGATRTLLDYWDHRGRAAEGLALLQQATGAGFAARDAALGRLLLSRVAHLKYRLDRYAEAEADAQRVLATADPDSERTAALQALNVLGTCAFRLGRWEDARSYFKQRLYAGSAEEHAHNMAVTLDHLALIEKRLGSYEEALRLSLQSLELHRKLGDRAGEALCLNNLASLRLAMKEPGTAAVHLQEAMELCDRYGFAGTRAIVFANLADAALQTGNLEGATKHAARAIESAEAIGSRGIIPIVRSYEALIAIRRGELDRARAAISAGLTLASELGSQPMLFSPLISYAELRLALDQPDEARTVLAAIAAHPAATHDVRDRIHDVEARLPAPVDAAPSTSTFDRLVERILTESAAAAASTAASLAVPR